MFLSPLIPYLFRYLGRTNPKFATATVNVFAEYAIATLCLRGLQQIPRTNGADGFVSVTTTGAIMPRTTSSAEVNIWLN